MNPIHECHPFYLGRPISPMYDRSRPLSEILMATPTGTSLLRFHTYGGEFKF